MALTDTSNHTRSWVRAAQAALTTWAQIIPAGGGTATPVCGRLRQESLLPLTPLAY